MSAAAVDLGPVPEFCLAQAAAVLIRPNASSIRVPTLAHHVAGVTGRSLVDRRASSVGILCHMRPHIQRAQLLDKSRRRRRPCLPTATAPPAGRHFTQKAADPRDHKMRAESDVLPPETAQHITATRHAGGRIVAAGTTSLRLLESAATEDGKVRPFAGETRLFILPGHRFRAIDVLLTNFYLPRSTLFILVARADPGPTRMRWPPATASFPTATPV